MVNKIEKKGQLCCRDIGGDCDFVAQAETEEEVLELGLDHACLIHDLCEISPEAKSGIRSLIMEVWAQGGL